MKPPVDEPELLMPHKGKMVLLDEIADYDETGLIAYAHLADGHVFVQDALFPSWAAMELMAQAVAAWSGCIGHAKGEAVRLGFLLGTRKLQLHFDALPVPAVLCIKIQLSLQDSNGFGVFAGELWLCNENKESAKLLAEANLNVYSPNEDITGSDAEM